MYGPYLSLQATLHRGRLKQRSSNANGRHCCFRNAAALKQEPNRGTVLRLDANVKFNAVSLGWPADLGSHARHLLQQCNAFPRATELAREDGEDLAKKMA